MKGLPHDGDEAEYSKTEWDQLWIIRGRIYEHKVLRVNFTTYNIWRDQDYVKPGTGHLFIMVAASEGFDEHDKPYPFWYAQVLGTYHANVAYKAGSSSLTETQ